MAPALSGQCASVAEPSICPHTPCAASHPLHHSSRGMKRGPAGSLAPVAAAKAWSRCAASEDVGSPLGSGLLDDGLGNGFCISPLLTFSANLSAIVFSFITLPLTRRNQLLAIERPECHLATARLVIVTAVAEEKDAAALVDLQQDRRPAIGAGRLPQRLYLGVHWPAAGAGFNSASTSARRVFSAARSAAISGAALASSAAKRASIWSISCSPAVMTSLKAGR